MSQKNHGGEGSPKVHKHEHHQPAKPRGLHRDWRLWAAVVVALVAMGIYVLTLDESLWPGRTKPQQPMPAATGP